MSRLGDSMDLPFEEGPVHHTTEQMLLAGGVVVMAAVVPLPDGDKKPALAFRFASPTGQFYPLMTLVLDDDQVAKLPALIEQAAAAAIRVAKEAS